jgi:hypothetical protein
VALNPTASLSHCVNQIGGGLRPPYGGCDIYRFAGDKIIDKNTFWKIVEHKERL